jgi:acyl carrier protein
MSSTSLSKDNVYERICEVIAEVLVTEKEEIMLESKLINDLGADSIDLLTFASKFQKEFNVSFSFAKMINDTTSAVSALETVNFANVQSALQDALNTKLNESEKTFIESMFDEEGNIMNDSGQKIVAELLTIGRIAEQIFNMINDKMGEGNG